MKATLSSAVKHFEPRFGRNGEQTLPRSRRALQGWRKFAPVNARPPLPTVGLVDGHGRNRPPCQLETVRARDDDRPFRLPATQRVAHASGTQIQYHPNQVWTPDSGTGVSSGVRPSAMFPARPWPYDETVMLHSPWMPRKALPRQPQNQSIWPFDQIADTKTFSTPWRHEPTSPSLGVEPSLRHGGVSHDNLTRETDTWLRSEHADGGVQTAQSNVFKMETQCPLTNRHARSRDGGLRTDHR